MRIPRPTPTNKVTQLRPAQATDMLDKPTKDMEPAPGWRFLQFLGWGDNRDTAVEPKAKKPPKEPEERKHQFATWYIFAAFLGVMLIQSLWLSFTKVERIPYSQFEKLLGENKISEVLVGTESIQGTLKEPFPDGRKLFHTVRVDPGLADKLKEHGVTVTGAPSSSFLSTILSWVLPIFIFYLIWTYGIRHMAERQGFGGLMAIGKSRAKVYVETDTKVTFRDVAGVDEAKYELQEVVAFLRDPKSFGRLGARLPKGVLLIGPPGTGKTLLARAVAGEAGVPYFSISGAEFVEMFTGADLANLINEAAIMATRRNGDAVTLDDFTAAIERVVAGLEKKSRVLGPAERGRVAHHEMGHALVAATLPGVDPVHKVSIIPRGVGALGYTMQRPTEDRFLLARQELENRIAVLMGGRAAEALIFDGEVSTAASDDLQRATQIAMEMVTRYGMNETVGQRTYAPPPQPFLAGTTVNRVDASETTERRIDVAVRDLVAKAFARATDILGARRADLDEVARLLLAQETLTADQFPAIRSTVQPTKPAA